MVIFFLLHIGKRGKQLDLKWRINPIENRCIVVAQCLRFVSLSVISYLGPISEMKRTLINIRKTKVRHHPSPAVYYNCRREDWVVVRFQRVIFVLRGPSENKFALYRGEEVCVW